MRLKTYGTDFIDEGKVIFNKDLVTYSGVSLVVFCVFEDLREVFSGDSIDLAQIDGLAAVGK